MQAGPAEVLPDFSFGEEAEIFVRLGGYDGDRWQARELHWRVGFGPVRSLHGRKGRGPRSLPEMLEEETVGLVWVGRGDFLDRLLAGGEQRGPS